MADQADIIAAFTLDQAERLTGVSRARLRAWDKSGLFSPSLIYSDRDVAYGRLYTFRDLTALRVIRTLRTEASVPIWHLREVKEKLAHLGEQFWASTTLYVLGRRVIFHRPDDASREEVVSGQAILGIPLKAVSGSLAEAVKAMRDRNPDLVGKIERRRTVAHNEPVIAGTRIPVRSVKAFADEGYDIDAIRREYPSLTEDDVRTAIAFEAAA